MFGGGKFGLVNSDPMLWLTLPPRPESVIIARRFVAERVSGPRVNDALTATSELVTNALMHAFGEFRLTSRQTADAIHIEVWDSNADGLPERREPHESVPGGRGLRIIEMVTDRWGHRPDPPGKTVWCTINLTT